MPYRICKTFEMETAHMLSKHPDRCRHMHGHSRRVEVVLSATELDSNDMVCDFKALKLAVYDFLDSFDHALCVNSRDPLLKAYDHIPDARIIIFEDIDPTSEVMAKRIFDYIKAALKMEDVWGGYQIGRGVTLERVRLWETRTAWAEYSE